MSFEHRLFDDAGFARADQTEIIPTVEILLERLGLDDAPQPSQVAGIRAWLADNEAPPSLRRSIERKGYGAALQDANALITANLPLIADVLADAMARLPEDVDLEDLRSAAAMALVVSAQHFDPGRHGEFPGYASRRIRSAIINEFRSLDWPRDRHDRAAKHQLREIRQQLLRTLGRMPTDAELTHTVIFGAGAWVLDGHVVIDVEADA